MVESSRVICKALNQSSSLKGLHWPQITQQSTNPKPLEGTQKNLEKVPLYADLGQGGTC